jgi:hypothetical protein
MFLSLLEKIRQGIAVERRRTGQNVPSIRVFRVLFAALIGPPADDGVTHLGYMTPFEIADFSVLVVVKVSFQEIEQGVGRRFDGLVLQLILSGHVGHVQSRLTVRR